MNQISIKKLIDLSKKPALYEAGESLFWNDPHVAQQMLKAHLDQSSDLASYRLEKVQEIVDFCCSELCLVEGDTILDCGCGPGFYCERFNRKGLKVTGIDISENSINYAQKSAANKKITVNYLCQNYLDMNYTNEFNAVFIIWQDFCVLNYSERIKFLTHVYKALKPNGYFVLDISTPRVEDNYNESSTWSAHESGFWSPSPHLVLENLFFYQDKSIRLNQYLVLEEHRERVFRIYHQHYTLVEITQLLSDQGFFIKAHYADLTGKVFNNDSQTIGIIAQKKNK